MTAVEFGDLVDSLSSIESALETSVSRLKATPVDSSLTGKQVEKHVLAENERTTQATVEGALVAVRSLRDRIGQRRKLAPEVLVVALAGTTGAGKSSLFNLLTGSQNAEVGVRRPTTTEPTAALFSSSDTVVEVQPLLEWLQIDRHVTVTDAPYELGPVVLVDLPDIDSIMQSHQRVAQRFIDVVDLIVWVVDPEKYADARIHEDYLRPLVTHAGVMEIVLNQTDRLTGVEVGEITADLHRILNTAGFTVARIHPMSVQNRKGVESLAKNIYGRAGRRQAQHDRLIADVRALGRRLSAQIPAQEIDLTDAFFRFSVDVAAASGTSGYAIASAKRYRQALVRANAWPPFRPLYKLRPTPPLPELTTARIARPVGELSAQLAHPVGDYWSSVVRNEAIGAGKVLQSHMDGLSINEPVYQLPRWIRWLSAAQWLGIAIMTAGLVSYGIEIAIRYFGVTIPPALAKVSAEPGYPALPAVPWSVVIGVVGLVVSIVGGGLVLGVRAISVRRWRRHVEQRINEQVGTVVAEQVIAPVGEVVLAANRYHDAVNTLVGS